MEFKNNWVLFSDFPDLSFFKESNYPKFLVVGSEFARQLKILDVSIMIFSENYFEYERLLLDYNSDQKIDLLENQPGGYTKFFDVFESKTRVLIHNYISSSLTLIDHSRVYSGKYYGGTKFLDAYNLKVNEYFKNSQISWFIKDLRRYIQHVNFPETVRSIDYSKFLYRKAKNPKPEIKFTKESLIEFSGWSSKSKQFIDNFEDYVCLDVILNDYYCIVMEFYKWFRTEEINYFKEYIWKN